MNVTVDDFPGLRYQKKVPKNLSPILRGYGAMAIYEFRKRIPVNRASQLSHMYANKRWSKLPSNVNHIIALSPALLRLSSYPIYCTVRVVQYVFSAVNDPFKMPITFSVSGYAYMVYVYVYYGW